LGDAPYRTDGQAPAFGEAPYRTDGDAPAFGEAPYRTDGQAPAFGGAAYRTDRDAPAFGEAPRSRLSQARILSLAGNIRPKAKDGSGREAEILAKNYGVAASTFYRARFLLKSASPEDLDAVRSGRASLNAVYKKYKSVRAAAGKEISGGPGAINLTIT
jgi:hypothetical protein